MLHRNFIYSLSVAVISASLSGCGGGQEERQRGNVVIDPPAKSTPEDSAATASTEESMDVAQAESPPPGSSPILTDPAPASETAQTSDSAAQPGTSSDGGTTFKGRVVVKGDAPDLPEITPSGNDPFCIDLGKIPDDSVVVGEDGGLADVFIWVRKVPSGVEAPAAPEDPAVLDQKNCRFIPPALIVQVGQTLLVKNDDPTLHNTRMSGLAINFNQTVSPNEREGIPVDINRAEIVPVPVQCDIHGWMSARILATDNPWNALTDENGNFEISNLPAGQELEFRIQHGKAGYIERGLKLTFEEGEVKEQTFEVDASKLSG